MDVTGNLVHINADEEFVALMETTGDSRLVVVDFYTTWCKPCKEMNPIISRLAQSFPKTLFIKVNAEKCMDTSTEYNISGVPAFVFFRNNSVIDHIQGKDPEQLERKIKLYEVPKPVTPLKNTVVGSTGTSSGTAASGFYGISSVGKYLDKDNCRCFNDLAVTSFQAFLDGRKLSSGKGVGKLLMVYVFNQPLMLQHFKIKAQKHSGPKSIKFFINQPITSDFENLTNLTPVQENILTESDLLGENKLDFEAVRIKPVSVLHVLVPENLPGHRKIEIDSLNFYGMPMSVIDYTHPQISPPLPTTPPSNKTPQAPSSK